MGSDFSIEDILIIFRRRLKFFLIPAILLTPILIVAVLLLPAQYTSTGTLLIQSPQISKDLVKQTNSSSALERIEIIKQRTIARPRLLEIANKTKLFPAWRGLSDTKKVRRMKKRFQVLPVRSEIVTGTGVKAVAFQIAYTDPSPEKAQTVANEFINNFVTLDRRQSVKIASDNSEFFENQTVKFQAELRDKQQEIAEFKRVNNGSLPDQQSLSERQLERLITQITSLDQQISSIEEDKRFVESQMASNASGGGDENSPEARLRSLRALLAEQRSNYTDSHPEVQALLGQIRALERQLAPGRELQNLQRKVDQAGDKLFNAEKSNAPEEEIEALSAEYDRLSDQFVARATRGGGLSSSAQNFLLQSSLVTLQKRARLLEERRKNLQSRSDELEDRISKTPAVESLLTELERERQILEEKLEANISSQFAAEQTESLQVEDRAERITPIDPAALPERPSSPNRPALIAVAILFSLIVGAITALGFEFLSPTIRGRGHLTALLDEPPLASIPYIIGENEKGFKIPFFGGGRKGLKPNGDINDEDIGVPA